MTNRIHMQEMHGPSDPQLPQAQSFHLRTNHGSWSTQPTCKGEATCACLPAIPLSPQPRCFRPTERKLRQNGTPSLVVLTKAAVLHERQTKQTKNLRCGNRKGLLGRNDQTHHRMGPKTKTNKQKFKVPARHRAHTSARSCRGAPCCPALHCPRTRPGGSACAGRGGPPATARKPSQTHPCGHAKQYDSQFTPSTSMVNLLNPKGPG